MEKRRHRAPNLAQTFCKSQIKGRPVEAERGAKATSAMPDAGAPTNQLAVPLKRVLGVSGAASRRSDVSYGNLLYI